MNKFKNIIKIDDKNKVYNIITNNISYKKKIIKFVRKHDRNIYIINASDYCKRNSYFCLINFLKKSIGICQNDNVEIIKAKIKGNKTFNLLSEDLIKFFKYYFNKNEILKKKNKITYDIYYKLYFLFMDLFKKMLINEKTVVFINNYEELDYWSKKIIDDFIESAEFKAKVIVFSKLKIKRDYTDRYIYSYNGNQRSNSNKVSNKTLSKLVLFYNKLSLEIIRKIFKMREEKIEEICSKYNLLKFEEEIYVLNKDLKIKVMNNLDKKIKEEIYHQVVCFLENENVPVNIYNYRIYYEYYSLKEKNKKKLQLLDEVSGYLSKVNAKDDILDINLKKYNIDQKLNCNSGDLVLEILSNYLRSSRPNAGLEFISNISLDKYRKYYQNKINLNRLYFRRILGNYKNYESIIFKYSNEAFENNWLELYFDWIGELIFFYYKRGQYENLKKNLSILDKYKDKVSPIVLINNFWNIKAIMNEEKNFSKAVEYYNKAITLADEAGEDKIKIMQINNLGTGLFRNSQVNKAMNMLNNALCEAKRCDYKMLIALTEVNLSHINLEIGRLNRVFKLVKESLEISRYLDLNKYVLKNYLIKGICLFLKEELDSSLFYFSYIIDNSGKDKFKKEKCISYIYISKVLYKKNKPKDAVGYFEKGLDIGNEIGLEEVAKYIPMYMDILNSVYSEEYAIRFAKRFLSKNNDININYLVLIKLKIIVLSVNLEKYEKIEQIEELLEYDIEEKYRSECYYTLLNLENNKNKLEYYRNKLIKYYKKREEAKYQVRLNKIK